MEETKKKGSGTTDLTIGRPLTRILQFALPLVLGTLFQQLYSFVDTIIVGRCISTDALGAVGTTYSLNFMIVGFVLATCNGFGIPVAESFGAKDRDDLHKYLFNGAVLCVVMSLVFAVVTTLVAAPLLQLIHTPAELLENAVRYIRIIFLGIPATVLYNYSSTVLRSLGDSKHPFYFLLVSSFLNIALDVLFIVPLGMGVEGAAIATVISQLVSGILCTWWFFTKVEDIHFTKENCVFSGRHCKRLAYIGFPMGFEYSVSAIGAVIMQDAINQLGSVAVAAQTAGEKIRQMFTLPMESVGMAMATYVGQNHGAGRTDRVKQGIRDGCIIQASYSAIAWVVVFLVKRWAVGLVLGDAEPAIFNGAVEYLTDQCAVRSAGLPDDLPLHAAGPRLQRTGRHLRRRRAHRPRSRRLAGRAPAGLSRHLHLEPPRLGLCPVLLRVHGHTGAEKGEPGGINQNQKSAPRFCTAERFFVENSVDKIHKDGAEHSGEHTGHRDGQAAHRAFDFAHLQGFAGADGMGRGADAHALGNGVGDVEHLADRLGQQVARNAGQDDDGTGQGRDAAQLSGNVHADGGGDGLGQQGHILLTGQAHGHGQSQRAAQTDQGAHRDARDDGGGVLLEQVPLFIQRDGQADGGGQQQIADRRGADFVIRVGDVQHTEQDDDEDAAQQQRVEDGLARHPVDEGAQCKGRQREQNAPRRGRGKKLIQQLCHLRQPPFCSACGG